MTHILATILLLITHLVPCGTQVTLTANPDEGYEFDHWSDDMSIITPTRVVEVMSDTVISVFYHEICDQNGNLPLVNRLNAVLMLDVDSLQKMGYYPDSIHCAWYRVVDAVDDLERPFPHNDVYVGTGLYYAKGESLMGNKYYCVMDLRYALAGKRCVKLQRSVIADLSGQGLRNKPVAHEAEKAVVDGRLVIARQGVYYTIWGGRL